MGGGRRLTRPIACRRHENGDGALSRCRRTVHLVAPEGWSMAARCTAERRGEHHGSVERPSPERQCRGPAWRGRRGRLSLSRWPGRWHAVSDAGRPARRRHRHRRPPDHIGHCTLARHQPARHLDRWRQPVPDAQGGHSGQGAAEVRPAEVAGHRAGGHSAGRDRAADQADGRSGGFRQSDRGRHRGCLERPLRGLGAPL